MPNDCTQAGVSGDGISLAEHPIPAGKLACLSGYAQSSAAQFALVKDKDGTIVAKITSPGTILQPQTMTAPPGFQAYFATNNGPYTVSIGAGTQSSQVRVLVQYETIAYGTTTCLGTWLFISEDNPSGGDCDFNDSTVTLSWHLLAG